MIDFDHIIQTCPDPAAARLRIEFLLEKNIIREKLESLSPQNLKDFIHLISISHFLYRFLSRHPQSISFIDDLPEFENIDIQAIDNLSALRMYKYHRLLMITWHDLTNSISYPVVLKLLSQLAENIIKKVLELSIQSVNCDYKQQMPLCIFAMGKLGAIELNYSSDIDLIFLCADKEDISINYEDYQDYLSDVIRKFVRNMEATTEDGFLYRVDLKLRPWGRNGPLVMSVDDTEHYYEASTEVWERFAWLRARYVAGNKELGEDILNRLQPYIYQKSLGSDDLDRFLMIKNEMAKIRKHPGSWNVKVGEGGIRDIEFFIQLLQIVNAFSNPGLKNTNTLLVLEELKKAGIIHAQDFNEIHSSYIFLRKLENRLQMVDEKQTHELPDEIELRLKIARSLGFSGSDDQITLEKFETFLNSVRNYSNSCFEKILPNKKNDDI